MSVFHAIDASFLLECHLVDDLVLRGDVSLPVLVPHHNLRLHVLVKFSVPFEQLGRQGRFRPLSCV